MTNETIRLGAIVKIINPNHSRYNQEARYMGPVDLPGMQAQHRICFDGKIRLLVRDDFTIIAI